MYLSGIWYLTLIFIWLLANWCVLNVTAAAFAVAVGLNLVFWLTLPYWSTVIITFASCLLLCLLVYIYTYDCFFSASSLIAVVFLVILPYWRRYRQTTDSVDSYMKWSRPPHSHSHHRLWCKYHTGCTHHHHIPHTYQYMRQHQITRYALVFSLTMTTMS